MSGEQDNGRTSGGGSEAGSGRVVGDPAVEDVGGVPAKAPQESKKPWGALVGVGALAAVLVVGAIAITTGGSEIDTATEAAAVTSEESTDAQSTAEDASDGGDEAAVDGAAVDPAEFSDEAMTSFVGGDSSAAVFNGEQFVSLSMGADGWELRTSTNGLDWESSPVLGIPEDGYASSLDFRDGTYVAIGDGYDEESGSTSWVATSTDGESWTVANLPGGGESTGVIGSVVTNDGIVIVQTEHNDQFGNEFDLLVDLGIVEEDSLDSYCGFDQFEPGGEITIFLCSYDEEAMEDEEALEDGPDFGPSDEEIQALTNAYDAASTDEERAAIEEELNDLYNSSFGSNEDTVTVQPGDVGFDELSKLAAAQNDRSMPMTTLVGPPEGPFTVANEFVAEGYSNGLAATDSGVFLTIDVYDEESYESATSVLSWSGSQWDEVGSLPEGISGQIHGFGDVLLLAGSNNFGQSESYVSTDGATWTESPLDSEINGGYSQFVSGEAGVVAVTMGFDDVGIPGGPPTEIVTIDKDGFVLEIALLDGDASLTGPDGETIYELDPGWEPTADSDIGRLHPISGDITFLDPDSGEDLVVITSADIEAAIGLEDYVEEGYVEPNQRTEVHFTADGATWVPIEVAEFETLSPNTSVQPVAVGDDEVIFALHTYQETPPELFEFEIENREPTEEEIAAIDLFNSSSGSDNRYIRVALG